MTGRMIPLQSELARTLDSARSGGSAASMRWKKSVAVIRVTRPPVRAPLSPHSTVWSRGAAAGKNTHTHIARATGNNEMQGNSPRVD